MNAAFSRDVEMASYSDSSVQTSSVQGTNMWPAVRCRCQQGAVPPARSPQNPPRRNPALEPLTLSVGTSMVMNDLSSSTVRFREATMRDHILLSPVLARAAAFVRGSMAPCQQQN
jgi:hypothetical protein